MAALLKACADQTRLRLLNLLAAEGEVCVCHLVDVLGTNQPKVSRHLAYLKRTGLVSDRKDSLWVYYRLSDSLAEHASRLIECVNSCCAESPEARQDIAMLRRMRTRVLNWIERHRPHWFSEHNERIKDKEETT